MLLAGVARVLRGVRAGDPRVDDLAGLAVLSSPRGVRNPLRRRCDGVSGAGVDASSLRGVRWPRGVLEPSSLPGVREPLGDGIILKI